MNKRFFLIKFSFSFSLAEFEGHPTTNVKNLPWSPLYCVLQQDEQTYTAYCSEELSVSEHVNKFSTVISSTNDTMIALFVSCFISFHFVFNVCSTCELTKTNKPQCFFPSNNLFTRCTFSQLRRFFRQHQKKKR